MFSTIEASLYVKRVLITFLIVKRRAIGYYAFSSLYVSLLSFLITTVYTVLKTLKKKLKE